MKETQPNRYKKELTKWDNWIQTEIDKCKEKNLNTYVVGCGVAPVFLSDLCKIYESRGYKAIEKWEHGYDQDYTGITFSWKKTDDEPTREDTIENMFTKYMLYEFFENDQGTGYNGGETLKESLVTPWKKECSLVRRISKHSKLYGSNTIYEQHKNGDLFKYYHVDCYWIHGKDPKQFRCTFLYPSLEAAQKGCEDKTKENPKGRKRNYDLFVVREIE